MRSSSLIRISSTGVLTGMLLLSAAGCGGDLKVGAATATHGDAFCTAADATLTNTDNVDTSANPAQLRAQMSAAISSMSAALSVAPKDIKSAVKTQYDAARAMQELLAKAGYDFQAVDTAAITTLANGQSAASDTVDSYLSDKCGIDTGS